MPRINAAKGGRRCTCQSDPITDVRIAWAARISTEILEVSASPTSIIRRAVAFYSQHLEDVLEASPDDLRVLAERSSIRAANRCNPSHVTEPDVLRGTVRSLRKLEQEKAAEKPRLNDILKKELEARTKSPNQVPIELTTEKESHAT